MYIQIFLSFALFAVSDFVWKKKSDFSPVNIFHLSSGNSYESEWCPISQIKSGLSAARISKLLRNSKKGCGRNVRAHAKIFFTKGSNFAATRTCDISRKIENGPFYFMSLIRNVDGINLAGISAYFEIGSVGFLEGTRLWIFEISSWKLNERIINDPLLFHNDLLFCPISFIRYLIFVWNIWWVYLYNS